MRFRLHVDKIANGWIILNPGGGPTDDKPDVVPRPPDDPRTASSFLNDMRCAADTEPQPEAGWVVGDHSCGSVTPPGHASGSIGHPARRAPAWYALS